MIKLKQIERFVEALKKVDSNDELIKLLYGHGYFLHDLFNLTFEYETNQSHTKLLSVNVYKSDDDIKLNGLFSVRTCTIWFDDVGIMCKTYILTLCENYLKDKK